MRQAKENGMIRGTICARMGAAIATMGVAVLALGGGLAVGATAIDQFKPVTQDRLLRATENPNDWLIYGGNYSGTWFTPLKQIDTTNVSKLAPAWAFSMGAVGGQDGIAVVNNGIMYITSAWSKLFALDAKTGSLLWMYEADLPENISAVLCCDVVNRGVAVLGDRVFWATLDGHLLALDARSGKVLWNVTVADWQAGYTLTAAPLIVKNKVLIGPGGGEFGIRGFLVAYDADTGKEAWKTYTVPAPGEPGSETWPGNTEAWRHGGGAPWLTGAYDPELNLVYWGTSNPSPVFYGPQRQGDDLYTSSMLALDADTGKIKWHFQFTPHDVWDYDGVNQPMLLDNVRLADGQVVAKALAQANRNGHFYLLDRTNGKVIYAHPFIHVDSIKVDPKTGKMTPLKFAKPDEPVVACGHGTAGKEWVSMAYSPLTHFVYVPAIEMCGKFFALDLDYQKGKPYYGGGHERIPPASGHVSAIDLATGQAAWRYDTAWPMYAGVLATGGGVLFIGNPQGELEALDQKTGRKLWGFKTGSGIVTNPMSFAVDGRQYVAISSGWSIVPSKAIAGAKLLDTPGQKTVLGSAMLFVFALPDAQRVSEQEWPAQATPTPVQLGEAQPGGSR
jgi:alcohol dehydrogenase (cytochrome c)